MSYQFYLTLHVSSVILLFTTLGAMVFAVMNLPEGEKKPKAWALLAAFHGVALVVLLVSGFGLIARLQYPHGASWPLWIWMKLILWFVLGGFIVLIKRLRHILLPLFVALPILGAFTVWTVVQKPGDIEWRRANMPAVQSDSADEAAPESAVPELVEDVEQAVEDVAVEAQEFVEGVDEDEE